MGSLGCLESHVRAWELVVERNIPMLVLEEDVHLDENLFSAVLPYLLYSLPKNFSLLYFGNLLGKDMESKLIDYNDLLWKVNGSNWDTYAYVISPQDKNERE
jgi:GR25 family glycosyltransferase involved in LPS biosynthesis